MWEAFGGRERYIPLLLYSFFGQSVRRSQVSFLVHTSPPTLFFTPSSNDSFIATLPQPTNQPIYSGSSEVYLTCIIFLEGWSSGHSLGGKAGKKEEQSYSIPLPPFASVEWGGEREWDKPAEIIEQKDCINPYNAPAIITTFTKLSPFSCPLPRIPPL